MNEATLPTNSAHEPHEKAQTYASIEGSKKRRRNITFDKNYVKQDSSQNKYKDVLSQPASELSHRERLLWLQKRRSVGLWVQCDECDRWRYLPQVLDRHQLPHKWNCRMHPDALLAKCSIPEEDLHVRDEEDLIHSQYSAGSIVWARVGSWPWWPAIVDDCPDTERFYWLDGFSDIPTHYHLAFFDKKEVTRAWVAPDRMLPYFDNKTKMLEQLAEKKKFKERIIAAIAQADEAGKMPLGERLSKFSFIARYKGHIGEPKEIDKFTMQKYKKKFLKKFNVNLELDDDDDNTSNAQKGSNEAALCTTNIDKGMEGDTIVIDTPVPNSDTTQTESIRLETPPASVKTGYMGDSDCSQIPVFETQESFQIQIPSPSSDNFIF